jgi:hypothetical protein
MTRFPRFAVLAAVAGLVGPLLHAQSFYPQRLDDKAAVYLTKDRFGVVGDGVADDTDALQKAVDAVADTVHQGILFVPEGRYRLSHTVFIWPSVRVIGYGQHRPEFILGNQTAGYGSDPAYMIVFTGGRTGERRRGGMQPPANAPRRAPTPFLGSVPPTLNVVDANPGTFYSAMSNIDFDLGEGNPGAIGIRFHVAQHCFLTHMTFHIHSGLAALQDIGNEAEDLTFLGGQYGIITGRPSPGWQFTLLDSTFDGQSKAAIKEHEAGLALVGDSFRNLPTAIEIEPKYIEELWLQHSRLENISGPAIVISAENSRLTEINIEDTVAKNVPIFAKLRESGKTFSGPGALYRIDHFTHGLTFTSPAAEGKIADTVATSKLTAMPAMYRVIPSLPAQTGWANARDLGVSGDGKTDDTAALQKALDEHPILYLPSGRYKISDTLTLRPDTVLIGLHPSSTQIFLADNTAGFTGVGSPRPMILAPKGGNTIVEGIGLFTGGVNNLAVAALWHAGKDSLLDDVRFLGGHGTNNADGTRMNPYNNTHSGDPEITYRWDAQYPSLWITDGGGGTFADIWTPDTFSQAGMYVSDTSTEGHVYELSSEHHVRNEIVLKRAANWELIALQTEEERGEGPQCLPLEIADSHNITIAEMHAYRVVSSFVPYPDTIHVSGSTNIRFRNLHIYSDSKAVFDNSVRDDASGTANRELEIAALDLPGSGAKTLSAHPLAKRLAGGFFNASSAITDSHGTLYFLDPIKQHIFRYSPMTKQLSIVSDSPLDPANIFFDHADHMMVVSYIGDGTVYTMKPDSPAASLQALKPVPTDTPATGTAVLPIDHWRFDADRQAAIGNSAPPWRYVSPDGTTFLPAGDDFVHGALYYGTKMADVLRAFSLTSAKPGSLFYVSDEGQKRTFVGTVKQDGSLADVKLFAYRGGESIAVAPDGNIYIAAGQIYVYRPDGTQAGEIDVPERPTSLRFGGSDGRTLFILARTSLYSAQMLGATK